MQVQVREAATKTSVAGLMLRTFFLVLMLQEHLPTWFCLAPVQRQLMPSMHHSSLLLTLVGCLCCCRRRPKAGKRVKKGQEKQAT